MDRQPTDNPTLPSFQCPEYQQRLEWWQTVLDCYEGDLNFLPNAESYLPCKGNEPAKAYSARLIQSPYEEHLREIISGFAGAISGVSYGAKLPQAIDDNQDNIDMLGNSLSVFFDSIDVLALRDSYVLILVDYYKSEGIDNRDKELKLPSQPFCRFIDPRQVINWDEDNGTIERITIREEYRAKNQYGYTPKIVYRCINGDTYRLVELQQTREGKWIEVPVINDDGSPIQGQYLNAQGQPLGYCPVIGYTLSFGNWVKSTRPEFLGLARQTIKLYQTQSDLWAIVNSLPPTPWYRGDDPNGLKNNFGEVSIGPHDFLFLGTNPNAQVGYLQAMSDSVKPVADLTDKLKERIRDYNLNHIGEGGHQRTATEIRTLYADIQKRLTRYAVRKASGIQSILKIFCDYLGVDSKSLPSISVLADITALLTDEKSIALLYKEGLLSLEAAVRRLAQLGYTQDAEAELRLLAKHQCNLYPSSSTS